MLGWTEEAGIGLSPRLFSYLLPQTIYPHGTLDIIGESPMSDDNVCEMCGKTPDHHLHSHHAIPRYIECSDDSDIVHVCKSCHRKSEHFFERIILYPHGKRWRSKFGVPIKTPDRSVKAINLSLHKFEKYILDPRGMSRGLDNWHDPDTYHKFKKEYGEKYLRTKLINSFRPDEHALYVEYVQLNTKTGSVSIYHACSRYQMGKSKSVEKR